MASDLSVEQARELYERKLREKANADTAILLELRVRHHEQPWPDGTGSNCAECVGRRFPCPTRQSLDRLIS